MVKEVKIPWAAWREPKYINLEIPDAWVLSVCRMNGADTPEMSANEIKNAILNPIGTPNLSEIAQGKNSVAIVVDDMTRPTQAAKILPYVFEELDKVGISDDQIKILLAVGAHRPMNKQDTILKLGEEIANKYIVENHHPYENLVHLGESKIGTVIDVNKTYYESDLKIAVGGVIPHLFAGFGGGAKIVLPGVCGIRTLESNHSAAMRGVGTGMGRMTGIREDIEDIADKVGLDFSVNVIMNEIGDIAGVFAGHYRDAHRKTMEVAKEAYKTELSRDNDILFLNSFPEDSELNQATKGLNILLTAPATLLNRKGTIVLMSSSYEGRGYHSLIAETGARLNVNFGDTVLWRGFVKRRNVIFYSPNISEPDLYHFFPKSVKLIKDWDNVIAELESTHGTAPKAAIFPTSMQLA